LLLCSFCLQTEAPQAGGSPWPASDVTAPGVDEVSQTGADIVAQDHKNFTANHAALAGWLLDWPLTASASIMREKE
jgi:hypothetical protein